MASSLKRATSHEGLGYINENGLRSQMWTQSPLQQNKSIAGNVSRRVDGCVHGLLDDKQNPIEKAYRLDTNMQLKKTERRCQGHGLKRHTVIEHKSGQQDLDKKSAVYTHSMCKALTADLARYAARLVRTLLIASTIFNAEATQWSCPKK